jgi:hypothetical protein
MHKMSTGQIIMIYNHLTVSYISTNRIIIPGSIYSFVFCDFYIT